MNIKKLVTFVRESILPALLIVFIVILCTCNFSCFSSITSLSSLNGDYELPTVDNIEILSSTEIAVSFSKEVEVGPLTVSLRDEETALSTAIVTDSDMQKKYMFTLDSPTELGNEYIAEGYVLDKKGNSLYYEFSFIGYNDHVADVILSEVRNAYSSKDKKAEFVELYVKKSGNLFGLSIVSANDGENRNYKFASIEVSEGEYITVHLRKIVDKEGDYVDQGMNDEVDANLSLSQGVDSNDMARDLWAENTKAVLGTSDFLYIYDSNNKRIVDALLWKPSDVESFNKKITAALDEYNSSETGIWKGDALCCDGMTTVNRSLSRINTETVLYDENYCNDKSQWIVACITSRKKGETMIQGPTPGSINSQNAYIRKTE